MYVKAEYPNINKVQVKRVGIVIYITYVLTKHASDDNIQKLFETTESYVNKEVFTEAITKEDKAEKNTFGRATMVVLNPHADNKKITSEVLRGLNIKNRIKKSIMQ